jgi:hypothetical protein
MVVEAGKWKWLMAGSSKSKISAKCYNRYCLINWETLLCGLTC